MSNTGSFDEWIAKARIDEEQWSSALKANPPGGNLYNEHPLMVSSGEFWRCAHGRTGFVGGLRWSGCEECRLQNPLKALWESSYFEDGEGI
jgi:hypothetical protein